ncbi:PIR protein, partial [Plasmodium sp. DRC-Itaito]
MKVHYINILLFVHALNILHTYICHHFYRQIPTKKYIHHTKIPTTRLLCECELYAPANYDNDPQMKEVMQQFEDRTSQRFHEYDDRMVEKRKECKDKCDKEIQKIILKDKLEKQMAEHFDTLQTDIQSDAIPTCICEKVDSGQSGKMWVWARNSCTKCWIIRRNWYTCSKCVKPAAIEAAK